MCTTVTTRQYLESNFEKTDKHLTRFRQDEKRLTALIQSFKSQLPWETRKKLESLLDKLCKKYAPNYTVGITACKSYYEKHGKLTAANHQGKFVNHQLIVWNAALEPEWREACRNMINVLLEKNNRQLPPLIFTITALKNLIFHYKLYDERGKLVENYQSAFSIIDETLNAPIPESMSSQFIQNKIDSAKPVNRQQPTDRSDLLNLRQNTTTIGEWVENVKSKYSVTTQMVYYYFKKFDINPKEEIKKPFEDLRTKLDEALAQNSEKDARIRELEMIVLTMKTDKSECDEWKAKYNNSEQEIAVLKQTILELTQNNSGAVQENHEQTQEMKCLKAENNKLKNDLTTANNTIAAKHYQAKKIIEEKDNIIKKKQNSIDDLTKRLKKYEN